MQTENELRGAIRSHTRSALNMLANKGSAKWGIGDQAKFDNYLDYADYSEQKLEALSRSNPYDDIREGVELYVRNSTKAPLSQNEGLKVRNAMSTTTGSQGGYTVSPLVAAELVSLLKGYGWMRQVATQFHTTNGADLSIPTSDGMSETGELLLQNAPTSSLDPAFGTVPINTSRISSKVFTVPYELLQDSSIDIVSFILLRMRERIGRTQNSLYTIGTGSSQPMGLVTAAGVGKTGATGQTTTVLYDDLIALSESVDECHLGMPDKQLNRPQTTAGWMLSQTARKVIRTLKDEAGRPIWTPGHVEGKIVTPAMLLDYPVYINNDMPVPAANAKSIAFGNLASYTIRDALDVTLLRMEDSAFTLKGQVGFLGTARTGGNLVDSSAVKTYQHSAT